MIIDSDQHLVEHRGLWEEHADPADRADALHFTDDEVGNTWITWRDDRIGLAEVQTPGDTATIGARHERVRRGEPPEQRYDDALPADHHDPAARRARVGAMGLDAAMLFPNYGLLWERKLASSPAAQRANMRAWNRWCAVVAAEGGGVLHPVAHLSLSDLDWLDTELAALSAAGVRTAMIAPALVDGRPLSHPDLDRAWHAFVDHGVSPVFHVADQPRPFADAWYTDPDDSFVPVVDSVFLWTAAALASTDLIVNGVLDRHPDLRLGIVELSAVWVPMFLMMLDGGVHFTTQLNGRPLAHLELPEHLRGQLGGADLLMACSDFPHSEGTETPIADYAATGKFGTTPDRAPGLFGANAEFLLRLG